MSPPDSCVGARIHCRPGADVAVCPHLILVGLRLRLFRERPGMAPLRASPAGRIAALGAMLDFPYRLPGIVGRLMPGTSRAAAAVGHRAAAGYAGASRERPLNYQRVPSVTDTTRCDRAGRARMPAELDSERELSKA